MQRWMLSFLVVLCSATLAAAQQMPPQPVTAPPGELPHIVAYDNDGILGDHIPIFGNVTELVHNHATFLGMTRGSVCAQA
jgi:hypothetical protein